MTIKMSELLQHLEAFLNISIIQTKDYSLHVVDLVEALSVYIVVRLVLFFLRLYFDRRVKQGYIETRKAYAIRQILRYFIYTLAVVFILDTLEIKITALLVGSTALFVGLGLGLQDVFKDLVAGIVLLVERIVTAGDIVEIKQVVGQVLEVGLRTTKVITREDIIILVPNKSLMEENVINWTQNQQPTRFNVEVSVAYGSDTRLVERLLLETARNHKETVYKDKIIVHFKAFGDSGLHFSLFFHCTEMFRIERVKSELRFAIDEQFREHNITIPFPQRDLWVRNPDDLKPKS